MVSMVGETGFLQARVWGELGLRDSVSIYNKRNSDNLIPVQWNLRIKGTLLCPS